MLRHNACNISDSGSKIASYAEVLVESTLHLLQRSTLFVM